MSSSVVTPNIDISKVEAINQKRTLAFINHWVLHTVAFLNQFSAVCEERLIALETKIRRADHTLAILEAKLSSVPDLEGVVAPAAGSGPGAPGTSAESATTSATTIEQESQAAPPVTPSTDNTAAPEGQDVVDETSSQPTATATPVSQDSRYAHYFKMLKMGVPEPAVKMKMSSEGVDPALLDDPNAPAPPGGPGATEQNDSDSDSTSSWSD